MPLKELFQVRQPRLPNEGAAAREIYGADRLPYLSFVDPYTIVTRDYQFLHTIQLQGLPYETLDGDLLDRQKAIRNALLRSCAKNTIAVWVHILRREMSVDLSGNYPPGFPQQLFSAYAEKWRDETSYRVELFLTIVRRPGSGRIGFAQRLTRGLSHKAGLADLEVDASEALRELRETTDSFVTMLAEYSPRHLKIRETPRGLESEQLRFLSSIYNFEDRPFLVPQGNLAGVIPRRRLTFGNRIIQIGDPEDPNVKFGALISLKDYPPTTYAGQLDAFLRLPYEYTIAQSLEFKEQQEALEDAMLQQRRMFQSDNLAGGQTEGIAAALEDTASGEVALGQHQMTVMVVERSLEMLEKAVSAVESIMTMAGLRSVHERLNLPQAYWGGLYPGNTRGNCRLATVTTLNVAALASLHNQPRGSEVSHWGHIVPGPLTYLQTENGTPIAFNFHNDDVGHAGLIGPSGVGKTLFVLFLIAMAMKYRPRVFIIDKDRGAEIFVRACGGSYAALSAARETGFNPLKLPDTPENQVFLIEWLCALIGAFGDPVRSEDADHLAEAVRRFFRNVPYEARTLENFAPLLGIGPLHDRLKPWHGNGQKAAVFGNQEDSLSFAGDLFGLEMGEILNDATALPPVLLYLFHRIKLAIAENPEQPTIVVLDEAWRLLDHPNPMFQERIKDWLKTLRKLNGIVIFATQSPEDLTESAISATIKDQLATMMLFPNPKASEHVYRDILKLSAREYELIRLTPKERRMFLVKQEMASVMTNLDLTGHDRLIAVLSTNKSRLDKCRRARERFGEDPVDWLPEFYRLLEPGDLSIIPKERSNAA